HEHLIMQAAIQPHIDSSISKTINCPPDLSFEAFKAVYLEAYERGLKGCTTFRPNAVTGSVLSMTEAPKTEPVQAALPLEAVCDPRGGQWMEGRYVPSLLAAIGGVIERHMIDTGFLKADAKPGLALAVNDGQRAAQCPRCGEAALVFQEGCSTCLSCGYSKCS